MTILEVHDVSKKYLKKQALAGLHMTIEEGKIVGLLGPNGSGKTTLLKLIAGLSRPSGGSIAVCGSGISCLTKERIAYLPDSEFLYPWMRIKDAIQVYAGFFRDFNPTKCGDLLSFMQLEDGMQVKSLSKGMKEKLAIALTLSRDAKLFILDEPLNGVDPVAREQILGAILKGFSFESSMLITSHLIQEVESLLDEVYFLKDGKIELHGITENLRSDRKMTLDELYREVFACSAS